MFKEKLVKNSEKISPEPVTKLLKGSEAPQEAKDSPFYNVYHWGMADWEENELYLPESSEAISFAMASHELGHLVDEDRIQPTRHDFEPTNLEELRAWDKGWAYLEPHLMEYFKDEPDLIEFIEKIKDEVERIMMEIVSLTKPFYQKTDKNELEQKNNFLETDNGKIVKERMDGIEKEVNELIKEFNEPKLLRKVDWIKFSKIIKKTLLDIERDNEVNKK